jgi:hypothetical protein
MVAAPTPPDAGVDEVQRVTIVGGPNGGTFLLEYRGASTPPIAYHPSAAQLQTAMDALSTVGPGNAVAAKTGNWDYTVTFTGDLAGGPRSASGLSLAP